jgi:hypothetical protein
LQHPFLLPSETREPEPLKPELFKPELFKPDAPNSGAAASSGYITLVMSGGHSHPRLARQSTRVIKLRKESI